MQESSWYQIAKSVIVVTVLQLPALSFDLIDIVCCPEARLPGVVPVRVLPERFKGIPLPIPGSLSTKYSPADIPDNAS